MVDIQKLAAHFRKVRTLRVVQLCLCIAALVLALIRPIRMMGIVVAGFAVVLYLFYIRRVTRQYCWEVIKANICYGLCAGYSDVEAIEKDSLSEAVFDGWKMLPRSTEKGDTILSRNGFSCSVKGKTLNAAEMTVHYGVANEKGRKSYHFLSGTSLWCEGGNRGDWLLLRRNWIHPEALKEFLELHGYQSVFAGEKLEEDFMLYSCQEDAQLTKDLEKDLVALAEAAIPLGVLRLSEEYNAAFLLNRFYTPKVHITAMPTPQELSKNTLPERDAIIRIFC